MKILITHLLAGASTAVVMAPAPLKAQDSAIALDEITVVGERGASAGETAGGPVRGFAATRSATGAKSDLPLKETPQSISVITQDQIRATGAQTPSEALRYTAGVQAERFGADPRFDWIKVRGFDAPEYLDGLQLPKGLYAWPRYDPFGVERIEVLKGPASVLYGQTPPGGLVNFVSKKPLDETQNEVRATVGNRDRIQGAFDLTGPANAEKTVLYRMIGLGRMSDTIVDTVNDDRLFLAPSVTFAPTDRTSLTILGHYTRDEGKALQFLPAQGTLFGNPNGRIPRDTFLGEPGYDDFERREWAIGYEFEHRFENDVIFRQKARYGSVDVNIPVIRGFGFPTAVDPANPTGPRIVTDYRHVTRRIVRFDDRAEGFTADNQLLASVDTGPLNHSFLFGIDYRKFDLDYVGRGQPALFDPIDVYNPDYGAAIPDIAVNASTKQKLRQIGFYAQDQIKFDKFVLLLSGRYDDVRNDTRNRLLETDLDRKDGEFTGRAGLLYNFDNGVSPYVSYSTMFQPATGAGYNGGALGSVADGSGKPFEPTTGDQIEAGVKYQPPGTRSLFTLSAYRLRQQNVLVPAPIGATQEQAGEIEIKGLEAEAKLSLDAGWDVVASYTYADSEITKSSDNPASDFAGNRFPVTPKHQAAAFVNYTFQGEPLAGLSVGAGLRYFGAHYGDQANTLKIPSYTLVDAAMRYDFGRTTPRLKGVEASITASNLFDKTYVSTCSDLNNCYYGNARTVIGTLAYRW
jgi:iron complex outermembrane receptor protein